MTAQINTQVHINSNPEKVWQILLDFNSYPNWNPFILKIEGTPEIGNKIKVKFAEMSIKPTVQEFKKNEQFSWIGTFGFKGIFDGHHSFQLIRNEDNSTTLFHKEEFKGILLPLFKNSLLPKTEKNFKKMNTVLKRMAENI